MSSALLFKGTSDMKLKFETFLLKLKCGRNANYSLWKMENNIFVQTFTLPFLSY